LHPFTGTPILPLAFGEIMKNSNLVLKFKLAGDVEFRVRAAQRITVGNGGLTFHDAETGVREKIDLGRLTSFTIQPVMGGFY